MVELSKHHHRIVGSQTASPNTSGHFILPFHATPLHPERCTLAGCLPPECHLTQSAGCNSNSTYRNRQSQCVAADPACLAPRVTLRPGLQNVHTRAYSRLRPRAQSCAGPLQVGPFCCELPSLRCEILACEIICIYAGTGTAGFCFICGFRLDAGCCLVVETTRGFCGICSDVAFLGGGQELHVIMDVRTDGR